MKGKFLKVSLCALLACIVLGFSACSDDDGDAVVITNLSGQNWYKAEVWLRNEPSGDLQGFKEVGTVAAGESCTVNTDCDYFYIYAKNVSGRMIMSKDIHIVNKKATVNAKDLY